MSRLDLVAVSDGSLRLAGGSFEPACTVVTGDDASALATLVAAMSGAEPARGDVLLDGRSLARSPFARREVASLRAQEALPHAPNLAGAVTRVLAARQAGRSAAEVFEPFGLGAWSVERPGALDRDELRSVALALALSHETAKALVLYEPLSTSLEPGPVHERIAAALARDAIVVIVTASLAAARSFGGPHVAVVNGVLQSAAVAA